MNLELHPVLPLAVAAIVAGASASAAARSLAVVAPLLAAALLLGLPPGFRLDVEVLGVTLTPLRVDATARVFGLAFSLFGVLAGLYAWTEPKRMVRAAGLALTAAGLGCALAGDALSLFFFWELLAVGSTLIVACSDRPGAREAATRYFLLHAAGGAALLAGVLMRASTPAGLELGPVGLKDTAGRLILAGILMNAAMPPLHAWLPDAYPAASPAGTVYLSAFTTKGAVAVLLRLFAGEEVLVWAGVGMALYGVVFAVLENDIRRLLGYHIVSQVGYMVCGVGLGIALARDGAAAHAFCHIFYKGLLLMGAGAVLAATGRSKLTELGGLAGRMPLVLALFLVGAASISGVPLFNGFVSKSMIVSAAEKDGRSWVELLLVTASMGTFLHTGLKLPYFTFFGERRSFDTLSPVPFSMVLAMVLGAAACFLLGLAPGLLYRLLPEGGVYRPYTPDHVIGALQLLAGTALGFWILRSKLGGQATRTLDADVLYRGPLASCARAALAVLDWGRRVRESLAYRFRGSGAPRSAENAGLAGQVATLIAVFAAWGLLLWMSEWRGR